jgi:vitamin B12 transporter
VLTPLPSAEIGLVGHYVDATSEFDGFDPTTFRRADTLDATDNRIFAMRGWGTAQFGGWALTADASYLDSENRNRLGRDPLNSTFGSRFTLGGQLSRSFGGHRVTAAVEHRAEDFRARDQVFFGGTDQDRSRELTAAIGQWRAEWSEAFATDVAVRHDSFSEFADATTFRGTALLRPAEAWTLHASYGEGIAQPTFYDLFGFFPGSFQGNPGLRPESSRGWEAGLRWRQGRASAGITGFSNRLRDEILDVFDPVTFTASTANATGKSRRRGVELDAQYRLAKAGISFNYTYLDAGERQAAEGALVREARRPRHSANLFFDGTVGPLEVGAGLSYVGERRDTDFETFPARAVTLDDYVLGSVKLGWRVTEGIEAYVRAENLFDANYEDAFGYNTPGRTLYAGLRARLGR